MTAKTIIAMGGGGFSMEPSRAADDGAAQVFRDGALAEVVSSRPEAAG